MIKPGTKQIIKTLLQNDDSLTDEERNTILQSMEPASKDKIILITAREAAEILNCCRRQLYNYVAQNKINAIRHSQRHIRFDKREIEDFAYGKMSMEA